VKPESYMTYKEVVDSLRSQITAANAKLEKLSGQIDAWDVSAQQMQDDIVEKNAIISDAKLLLQITGNHLPKSEAIKSLLKRINALTDMEDK